MIHVAVLGYGTVGSGVVEVIEKNKEMVNKKATCELEVKYILDLRDFPDDPYAKDKVVHDFNLIAEDEDVQIVCETMGGVGAAYEFTKKALEAGKSVCTSNKELVAKHGPELLEIAKSHNCNYLFEASVGGGIPIIRPLNYSLTAEKIESITGILNGTTNYILSKMDKDGADFESVLKEAQEKGYAERNPEADVEGHDACRKIAILSSLMLGKNVDSEKIFTEGITKISAEDFLYAKEADCSIKLLAVSRALEDGTALAMVSPCMISMENPLAMVNDVFNAVLVRGNMLGDSMYYGKGAGKLPTASAVVSDVIDCARHQGKVITCFWDKEEALLADVTETKRAFFVRAKTAALDAVKEAFPGGKLIRIKGRDEDFGYFTPVMKEKDFQALYQELGEEMLNRIRLA
ncbi:MAG: homoserine dehydrogenase [Bacteroidales bacterium]|nr:homoserine dehydrogenase [Lachnoclostridium sp.]MCM1383651.1 homoserine dehydrogenase [Lachnoclostridium sp.]MCM1466281.1 homoserine dehydrogenase [Bacteroidales bacterium]